MDIKFPFGSFPGEFLQKYFESNCTLMLIEEIDFVLNNWLSRSHWGCKTILEIEENWRESFETFLILPESSTL